MPGSGNVTGNFALELALDEMSWKLGIDPVELRLRNYTDVHPNTGLPWSSKALNECYRAGAERFGWRTSSHAFCPGAEPKASMKFWDSGRRKFRRALISARHLCEFS